jgi:hypothetical protein
MKDGILLILAAVGCSLGAWIFWHFLGSDAFTTLMIVAFISMTADNLRLRKELRAKQSKQE